VVIFLKSNYQPTLDWTMPLDPIIPYFNDQMYCHQKGEGPNNNQTPLMHSLEQSEHGQSHIKETA